jgi:putative tryptophan/tyrosine transport system substrate-binding protein
MLDRKRRKFLAFLGSAVVVWSRSVHAQQARRLGMLIGYAERDTETQARLAAFRKGLDALGWTEGRNVLIDYRFAPANPDQAQQFARELVALRPEVLVGNSTPATAALLHETHSIPIVFVGVSDPLGSGFVASLARPGGNATGFTAWEFSLSGKLLELLKEVAPRVTRVAVLRDPFVPAGSAGFAAIQTVAPSFGVELVPVGVRDADEIERGIATFAHGSNDGLIMVGPPSSAQRHRDSIVTLAARHRLPAVYSSTYFVTGGGLISYGTDPVDQHRRAADYVDRILKGEKPADLPVQAPTKYELVINLKTAKALGLDIPASVLARADEVIE